MATSESSLEDWLESRIPGVPVQFRPYLLRAGEGGLDPLGLAARGEAALRRALDRPGRVRSSAFDLLAADAFLTWACEAMAREADVGSGLQALLEGLGAVLEP